MYVHHQWSVKDKIVGLSVVNLNDLQNLHFCFWRQKTCILESILFRHTFQKSFCSVLMCLFLFIGKTKKCSGTALFGWKYSTSDDCGRTNGENKETSTSMLEGKEKSIKCYRCFRPVTLTESFKFKGQSVQGYPGISFAFNLSCVKIQHHLNIRIIETCLMGVQMSAMWIVILCYLTSVIRS